MSPSFDGSDIDESSIVFHRIGVDNWAAMGCNSAGIPIMAYGTNQSDKTVYQFNRDGITINNEIKLVTNADLDVWVNQIFATQQKISAKHWVTLDTGVVIPSDKIYKVGVVVYTGNQFVFPLNVYVDSSNRHVMAELSNVSDTEVTVQFATIRVCYGN